MREPIRLIPLEIHRGGKRGDIAVYENLPFRVKRVFTIFNVPITEMRGGHAHKKCKQLFIAAYGAIMIILGDGRQYLLDYPGLGLYVPPRHIVHIKFITEGASLVVLASECFDKNDYIYPESS